jgi:hypothetical protein
MPLSLTRLFRRPATRRPSWKPSVECLEDRSVPAAGISSAYARGALTITISADSTAPQSVTLSSYQGYVTLNEAYLTTRIGRKIKASSVTSINVQGSSLANRIDLGFVSSQQGFGPQLEGRVTLVGGGGDDVIVGSQFADALYGEAGFDQISGGSGNDQIFGGDGNDWIYAGPSNGQGPSAGNDNDTVTGGAGADWYDGGDGYDTLTDRTADELYAGFEVVNGQVLIAPAGQSESAAGPFQLRRWATRRA